MKKLIALVLAMVMVLALAACAPSTPDTPSTTAPKDTNPASTPDTTPVEPAADDVELKLWTYPVGNWGDQATVDALIADFNAVYPNIHVSVEYLDYTNGDDKVNTAIEGNAAPDLVFEGPERLVANWGAKGLLVDLSDLMDSEAAGKMYAATKSSCTSADGAMYEFPVCQTAHCMAINRDVFEAAGAWQYVDEETHTWTTENFLKAVQAVYEYGQDPVGVVFCGGQGGDQGNRALITNMYGGTYANAEHTEYTFFSPENVKALETLYAQDGINFDPAIVGGDEIVNFVNGTFAMATCWNVAQEKSNADALTFDVFPMAFPTESGDPILQGGIWGFGVFNNGDQAKIDAAKTFIRFMTEDDAQYTKAVEASSYWAVRDVEGVYEGDELMTEYGTLIPFMGDYYQITKGWAEARTIWWNMLQKVGAGEDVATVLEAAQTDANAAAAAAG